MYVFACFYNKIYISTPTTSSHLLHISAQLTSSTGCPQGCVLSPVLFSLYIQDTPALDTSFQTIKYADDLAILELVRYNSVSMIHHAADTLLNWCTNLDLAINVTKTKDMIFSNARDSPTPDQLVINTTTVEQVDKFKYLGTVLDCKMNFKPHTEYVDEKMRKRLFIMKLLYAMGISEPIRVKCYETFIESILKYHLPTVFGHLLAESKTKLNKTIKSAAKLSHIKLENITAVYNSVFGTRCLRLLHNDDPFMSFDELPSGRLRAVKHRVNLRKHSFRSRYVTFINSKIF